MEGQNKVSWNLADITFSKIEVWFVKKTEGRATKCSNSSEMPGFSARWSTNGGSGRLYTVPRILDNDKQIKTKIKVEKVLNSLKNLRYTILDLRRVNLTTHEIWKIIEIHKRELVEGNDIGCTLGYVSSDRFSKLIGDLKKRVPKNRSKVSYKETPDDNTLAFDIFSYLIFCNKEQIEMAVFYNNLFLTGSLRTILQATMNNLQSEVKDVGTMTALRQIYKTLAEEMDLKLPDVLHRFADSKMLDSVFTKSSRNESGR